MKSKLGVGIIILVFVISLNPYTLVFTIPVFLIGCILLLFSEASTIKKVVFTIVPLILWYPSFIGFLYLNSYLGVKFAQKIEFRIPVDFRGQIMMIFPVKCGQEVREENGREIIDIPENGIVYYQGDIETGYINWTYMLQGAEKISEIDEFKSWILTEEELNRIRPDSLGVFGGGGWTTYSVSATSSESQIDYSVRTLMISEWENRDFIFDGNLQDSLQIIYEEQIRKCKNGIEQ